MGNALFAKLPSLEWAFEPRDPAKERQGLTAFAGQLQSTVFLVLQIYRFCLIDFTLYSGILAKNERDVPQPILTQAN